MEKLGQFLQGTTEKGKRQKNLAKKIERQNCDLKPDLLTPAIIIIHFI